VRDSLFCAIVDARFDKRFAFATFDIFKLILVIGMLSMACFVVERAEEDLVVGDISCVSRVV
jgi:hypothetical protein